MEGQMDGWTVRLDKTDRGLMTFSWNRTAIFPFIKEFRSENHMQN